MPSDAWKIPRYHRRLYDACHHCLQTDQRCVWRLMEIDKRAEGMVFVDGSDKYFTSKVQLAICMDSEQDQSRNNIPCDMQQSRIDGSLIVSDRTVA